MTLEQLCDILRLELQVTYTPKAAGPWISRLVKPFGKVSYKENLDDGTQRTCCGWGSTPEKSIQSLYENLFGGELHFIIIDSDNGEARQKFGIPTER